MRRLLAVAGVAAFATGTIGCDDPSAPPSVVAAYVLQTVDGQPLPYVYPESTERQGIRSRRITLYDNDTFTDHEETFSGPAGAERRYTHARSGQYTLRSASLQLAYPPVEGFIMNFEGTINGGELTIFFDRFAVVRYAFRREP